MASNDYEILDERFRACFNRISHVERLWTGARWTEGPVYFPAGRYLLFSDIPNDRMMRYDETDGSVSVFRTPCDYTNGHTVDRQGRLVSCEHGGRRVTRTAVLVDFGVSDLSVYDCVPGSELGVDLWVEQPNPPGYSPS